MPLAGRRGSNPLSDTIIYLRKHRRPRILSFESGFRAGAIVTFSVTGVTASVVTVSADRTTITLSLSVTAAASTGYRSVTVANPDGGVVTKANAFRVT